MSKSMLSQIERNQANPTVAVVWRLANALGVPLGQLLDGERPALPAITTIAGHATPSLRSPDGKCEAAHPRADRAEARRAIRVVRTHRPNRAASSSPKRTSPARANTSASWGRGTLDVRSGADHSRRCGPDETARYAVDVPHAISNIGAEPARALLVVVHPA